MHAARDRRYRQGRGVVHFHICVDRIFYASGSQLFKLLVPVVLVLRNSQSTVLRDLVFSTHQSIPSGPRFLVFSNLQ